jgi:hypothetical protein
MLVLHRRVKLKDVTCEQTHIVARPMVGLSHVFLALADYMLVD